MWHWAYNVGSGDEEACRGSKLCAPSASYLHDGHVLHSALTAKQTWPFGTRDLLKASMSLPTIKPKRPWDKQEFLLAWSVDIRVIFRSDCPKVKERISGNSGWKWVNVVA
ncbi:hypothetical protein Tco_0077578 [Tanacetum coccineum]